MNAKLLTEDRDSSLSKMGSHEVQTVPMKKGRTVVDGKTFNAEGESRAASARTLHPLVGSLDSEGRPQ